MLLIVAAEQMDQSPHGDHRTFKHRRPRKLPGMTKYSNIVLKRGVTDDTELYDWHRRAVDGDVQRRNGWIVLLDRQGNERVRWNFVSAWPAKWDGPDFNAEGNDVAIETLELAHEGVTRA